MIAPMNDNHDGLDPIAAIAERDAQRILGLIEDHYPATNPVSLPLALIVAAISASDAIKRLDPPVSAKEFKGVVAVITAAMEAGAEQVRELAGGVAS